MRILWDESKAESNIKKHGVAFEEAATVLSDPGAQTFMDDGANEERFITVGYSTLRRLLLVVWCERDGDIIRINSARKTTPKERRTYEKGV
jgi:uncharacterized DUF497 family protein